MNSLLVRVPVALVIISRLSSGTLGVATLVRPSLDVDVHLVTFQGGAVYTAFTTVRAEEPFLRVLTVNYLHMSLEFLESFATNVADLRIVNTLVVTPFFLRCTEYFVTGNTREFCASLCWRLGNTWHVFPHHVFLQFVSRVSDVITDTAGQRLTMYRVKVVPERLVRLADEFTLVTEHMTPVDSSNVSLPLLEAPELQPTLTALLSDLVTVEMVGKGVAFTVRELLPTVLAFSC